MNHLFFSRGNNKNMYPLSYRQAVIEVCVALGRKIRETANLVQASASSISRWMRRLQPITTRSRASIITDEIINAIKEYMKDNPTALTIDITKHVNERFDLKVSRQLIQRVLSKKLHITYKRTKKRNKDLSHNAQYMLHKNTFCHIINDAFQKGIYLLILFHTSYF